MGYDILILLSFFFGKRGEAMKVVEYDERIYQRIEEKFDWILPYATVISWLSALAIAFTDIPNYFVYIDGIVGLVLLVVYLNRRRLSREVKVSIVIAMAMAIGIISFTDGGFSSGAIALILVSNGMAILLLEKEQSFVIAVLSVLSLFGLWFWSWKTGFLTPTKMHAGIWIIQILLVSLFVFIFRFAAYAIRNQLLEKIHALESSMAYANQLAYYDQLTNLPNYMAFTQFIEESQEKQPLVGWIIVLSFKNLHIINSVYGAKIGDRILIRATQYIQESNTSGELLARAEGNQFIIWIPRKEQLKNTLNRIDKQLMQAFEDENLSNLLGYYLGYAQHTQQDGGFEGTYQKALLAMTYAKYSKAENIMAYNVEFEEKLKRDTYLMEQLKKDLVDFSNFKVLYQTQNHVDSHQVVGLEALSRWSTKTYGPISAREFINFIDQIGLHREFGYFVLNQVMLDYAKLTQKFEADITVSVNIEPTYLMDARFLLDVEHLLQKHNFKGSQLIFEITESVAINGIEKVNQILHPLREVGIQISLDDFGTGYSALNYLVNLEVNEVKIDKMLIDSIVSNAKGKVMLKTLKDLAQEFELRLVAEGVETEEQYQTIRDIGYKIIQGYYFSKPEDMV